MKTVVCVLLHALRSRFLTRWALQAENLALRHQITALQRGRKRLLLNAADRFLWVCLSRLWAGWRSALAIFKPETVIARNFASTGGGRADPCGLGAPRFLRMFRT
jgi:hypothetical protein